MKRKIRKFLNKETNYQYSLTEVEQKEILGKLNLVSNPKINKRGRLQYVLVSAAILIVAVVSSLITYITTKNGWKKESANEYAIGISKLEEYRLTHFTDRVSFSTHMLKINNSKKIIFVDEVYTRSSYNIVVLSSFEEKGMTTISIHIEDEENIQIINCKEEFTTYQTDSLTDIPNITVLFNNQQVIFKNY